MNVQPFTALGQRCVDRVDRKHTAATVEVGDIATLEMIPGGIAYPCGQHSVEDQAARGGKHKSTLRLMQSLQAAGDAREVRTFATEALCSKVVGHASLSYLRYPRSERAR